MLVFDKFDASNSRVCLDPMGISTKGDLYTYIQGLNYEIENSLTKFGFYELYSRPFFLQSSRNRVELLSYEIKTTDKTKRIQLED